MTIDLMPRPQQAVPVIDGQTADALALEAISLLRHLSGLASPEGVARIAYHLGEMENDLVAAASIRSGVSIDLVLTRIAPAAPRTVGDARRLRDAA